MRVGLICGLGSWVSVDFGSGGALSAACAPLCQGGWWWRWQRAGWVALWLKVGDCPSGLVQKRWVSPGSRMVDLPPVSVPDQRVGAWARESPTTSVPPPGAGPGLRWLSCPAPFKPSRLPESLRGNPGRGGRGAGAAGSRGPAQICRRITLSDSSPGPAQPAQPAGLFQSGRAGEGFPAGTGPARAGLCRAPRRPASRAAGTALLAPVRSRCRSCSIRLGKLPLGWALLCSVLLGAARSGAAPHGAVRSGSVRFAPVRRGRAGWERRQVSGAAGCGARPARAARRSSGTSRLGGGKNPPELSPKEGAAQPGPWGSRDGEGKREPCPRGCRRGGQRGASRGPPEGGDFPRPPLRDQLLVPAAFLHLSFSTYVIGLFLLCFVLFFPLSLLFPGAGVGCGDVWDTLILQVDSWAGGSALLGWEGCLLLLFQLCAILEFYVRCCSSPERLQRWRLVFGALSTSELITEPHVLQERKAAARRCFLSEAVWTF